MNDNTHEFLHQDPAGAHIMAPTSNTNLILDRSQQIEADTSPTSVETRGLLHQLPTNTDIMANSSEAELAHDQSKRTGEDTSATLVNSANVQEYEVPAVAAVLQTNELLHLIIAEVPREYRTSIRRVSKTWKLAVEKIGYAFQPLGHALSDIYARRGSSSPLYPAHKGFRFHPVLMKGELLNTWINIDRECGLRMHYGILWTVNKIDFPEWEDLEREFVANPPVTEVVSVSGLLVIPMMQKPGGIRLGDLMDHVNKFEGSPPMHLFFATPAVQDHNTEPEMSTSEDEDDDEEESDESNEREEAGDSERQDADDGAKSSSESDRGSEQGDSKSGEDDQVERPGTVVDAVLQTNELLHLITGEVPLEDRNPIRGVAKAWQAPVVKIGHVLQPVAHNAHDQPVYSVSRMPVANISNPLISCYQGVCMSGSIVYGFEFNPCRLSGNPKIAERECEFLTEPPITHALLCLLSQEEDMAVLGVHGGIRVGDLRDCFERMSPADPEDRKFAYIAVERQEEDASDNIFEALSPSEPEDTSESDDEGDGDSLDESDSGAGGAGTAASDEPDDSGDGDGSKKDDSEGYDAEDPVDSNGGSEGDSRSG
jgi:hypothetical protein